MSLILHKTILTFQANIIQQIAISYLTYFHLFFFYDISISRQAKIWHCHKRMYYEMTLMIVTNYRNVWHFKYQLLCHYLTLLHSILMGQFVQSLAETQSDEIWNPFQDFFSNWADLTVKLWLLKDEARLI